MADFRELPPLERAILRALHRYASHGTHGTGDENEPTALDISQMVGTLRLEGVRTRNRARINQRLARLMANGYVTRRVGSREPSNDGWGRRPYRYSMTPAGEQLYSQAKEA
jgi:DNA-binding MarR family transcriptional regulator